MSPISKGQQLGTIEVGDIRLREGILWCKDNSIPLKPKEYHLLHFLGSSPEKVFGTDLLSLQIWGSQQNEQSNAPRSAKMHVNRKLATIGSECRIASIIRSGYFLQLPPDLSDTHIPDESSVITGDLMLDSSHHMLHCQEINMALTYTETHLLKYFLDHPCQIITKLQLLAEVWNWRVENTINTRTVDMHISRLRKKLVRIGSKCWIETKACIGRIFWPSE